MPSSTPSGTSSSPPSAVPAIDGGVGEHPSMAALAALLAELDAGDRGFILAVLLTAGNGGGAAVHALGGAGALRCQQALERIAGLTRPARARLIGLLAREALAPVPAGFEHVDVDLIAAALRRESPVIAQLVAAHGPPLLERAARQAFPGAFRAGGAPLPRVAPALIAELRRAVLSGLGVVPASTDEEVVDAAGIAAPPGCERG